MTKLCVLVDADMMRYSLGGVQMPHPFIKGEFVPASIEHIHYLCDVYINNSLEACGTDEYECVLSGVGNFRHEIAKQQPYKGNRSPGTTRPFHYDTVGNYLIERYNTVVVDGMEADDYIGIKVRSDPSKYASSSRDKDFKTFHGWHYSPACGNNQVEIPLHWIDEFSANHFFYYQLLIGDNTDNIPGCGIKDWRPWGIAHVIEYCNGAKVKIPRMMLRRKGVGDKTALAILKDATTVRELHDLVQAEYQALFPDNWEEVMLENARLLYVGQRPDNLFDWSWVDFDIKKEEIDD